MKDEVPIFAPNPRSNVRSLRLLYHFQCYRLASSERKYFYQSFCRIYFHEFHAILFIFSICSDAADIRIIKLELFSMRAQFMTVGHTGLHCRCHGSGKSSPSLVCYACWLLVVVVSRVRMFISRACIRPNTHNTNCVAHKKTEKCIIPVYQLESDV